jgi:hypothetical protein
MKTFNIRYPKYIPYWAYAEVKAENIDDALELLEDEPDRYELDVGEEIVMMHESNAIEFAELEVDGEYISVDLVGDDDG